jgi:hypothetical protein
MALRLMVERYLIKVGFETMKEEIVVGLIQHSLVHLVLKLLLDDGLEGFLAVVVTLQLDLRQRDPSIHQPAMYFF